MGQFRARFNGHLPDIGLVSKGDIVEYNGIHRAWLEPVKGKVVEQEELDRKGIIAKLKEMNVPFFKGAKTEELDALLVTHKGMLP
jgi:hypothetical protein